MAGPLLHLALVVVLLVVLAVLGLEAWNAVAHALTPLLSATHHAKEVTP